MDTGMAVPHGDTECPGGLLQYALVDSPGSPTPCNSRWESTRGTLHPHGRSTPPSATAAAPPGPHESEEAASAAARRRTAARAVELEGLCPSPSHPQGCVGRGGLG